MDFFFKEKMWAILYREWKPNKRNSIKLIVTKLKYFIWV